MAALQKFTWHLLILLPFTTYSWSVPHHYAQLPLSQVGIPARSQSISAISWGVNRLDVFANDGLSGNVSHKWWDGHQWGPSASGLEILGGNVSSVPAAVSWGKERLDIFATDTKGTLYHKYFDGSSWQPSEFEFESLADGFDQSYAFSASTWGPQRLDVFGLSPDKNVLHKYWDGFSWQPDGRSVENLGGQFRSSGISAVSWGSARLDIFALEQQGYVQHKYWDGGQWVGWDFLDGPQFNDIPSATSWGENRLDLVGVGVDGIVYHTAWDGSQWLPWENLGERFAGKVGVTGWSADRLDLVALSETDGGYYYKYWDGKRWNPDVHGWYNKKGHFTSSPAVVSWGPNRLDIYGIDINAQLAHQTWWGDGWYPGPDEWESLGGPIRAFAEQSATAGEL